MFFDNSLIAIDIGTSAVKIIELSGKGEKSLQAVGLETIPPVFLMMEFWQMKRGWWNC